MLDPKIKVLVLSVSWIGNTILQSPMINAILNDSRYETDVLFANNSMAGVYAYNNSIKEKIVLTDFSGFYGKLRLLKKLYTKRYIFSIAGFPSHRISFHILPFILRIKNRCIHSYNWGNLLRLSFLSNRKIIANPVLHDVEQNLDLLYFLWISRPKFSNLYFWISDKDLVSAKSFIRTHKLNKEYIIGIHPGSGDLEFKRWGDEKYKALINILIQRGYQIVLFWSGKELNAYTEDNKNIFIFRGTINETGAMIKHCKFFVSGDTGLMHIAAFIGIEQVVIWKGTLLSRTKPVNRNAKIVYSNVPIIYQYPFLNNSYQLLYSEL